MGQDNCLNPCISCIDDGHSLRPAKPHCGDRVACSLHVQPLPGKLPVHSDPNTVFLRAVNLLQPVSFCSCWRPAGCEWVKPSIQSHAPPCKPFLLSVFLQSYCCSQVVFEQCCTIRYLHNTPVLEQNNAFQLQEYISSNVPTIVHRFLSTCIQ